MDFCSKTGQRSQIPRISLNYAGTLLDRGGNGDREQARTLIEESLAIAETLGMGPVGGQLIQLQEGALASSSASPGSGQPAGLSQRETEVIRLIAAGKTDREIANELIIAVRTVTTHVGNILNKTGSANRAEAASFATRHGLD